MPEDGALAAGAVDDDVGRLVGTSFNHVHAGDIDAAAPQAVQLKTAAIVVADGADVAAVFAERLAGDDRRRDLSARFDALFQERDFAGVGRKLGNDDGGCRWRSGPRPPCQKGDPCLGTIHVGAIHVLR